MTTTTAPQAPAPVHYPDSDGRPMSDNTKQAHWIILLYANLRALFAPDPNVFVAADNLWYPVAGRSDIRIAPDVYVVFGRPQRHRGSYKQWEEEGVPITVAFEVLSPGNTVFEMADKLHFYDEYGVEEYYVYDPDTNRLLVYRRGQEQMPASRVAQELAQTDGVLIRHWLRPVRVLIEGGGVAAVEFAYTDGTTGTLTLACDQLLKAIGQAFLPGDLGDEVIELESGRLKVDAERRTSLAGVWAGGDCVAGGKDLTVAAVEDGKQAALSIDRTLRAATATRAA